MNKNDMMNLIHHLISTGRFWHLEYARLTVVDSEFQKIKSYREKFDEDLLKKGEDIINGIEREGNIKSIKVFLEGYNSLFTNKEYSSHQLEQILDSLKKSENIDTQNSIKALFINKQCIYGYEVSYESEYDEIFTKNKQEEQI